VAIACIGAGVLGWRTGDLEGALGGISLSDMYPLSLRTYGPRELRQSGNKAHMT
jgi:hypothetical protein